jgi:hypothetical protein
LQMWTRYHPIVNLATFMTLPKLIEVSMYSQGKVQVTKMFATCFIKSKWFTFVDWGNPLHGEAWGCVLTCIAGTTA